MNILKYRKKANSEPQAALKAAAGNHWYCRLYNCAQFFFPSEPEMDINEALKKTAQKSCLILYVYTVQYTLFVLSYTNDRYCVV